MSSNGVKSLSAHLMDIVQKYKISKADRKSYTSDVQHIQDTIIYGMSLYDPMFKNAFRGLSLAGSYLDDVKLELPDYFEFHMRLELPFKLSVEKDTNSCGNVFLRNKTTGNYPIFNGDGYLNRKLLQKWLRENFSLAIKNIGEIQCRTGHTYQLQYTQRGEGCVHTIEATDKRQPSREISFDFVPVFEFPKSELLSRNVPCENGSWWFAVPQNRRPRDENIFLVCAPDCQRTAFHYEQKLKDAFCLTKALLLANNMPHLRNFMLKNVFLKARKELRDSFWSNSISNILIQIFNRLVNSLEEASLVVSFLVPEVNYFDYLNSSEIQEYHNTAERLMSCIQRYNNSGRCVEYEDVAKLFKLA